MERSGIDYSAAENQRRETTGKHRGKARIGRYIFLKDKEKGVEPGFAALKSWSQGDTQKMLGNHKFCRTANSFIDEQLSSTIKSDAIEMKKQAVIYLAQYHPERLNGTSLQQHVEALKNGNFDFDTVDLNDLDMRTIVGEKPNVINGVRTHLKTQENAEMKPNSPLSPHYA